MRAMDKEVEILVVVGTREVCVRKCNDESRLKGQWATDG